LNNPKQVTMEEKIKTPAAHALIYCLIPAGAMIVYGIILYLFNENLNRFLSALSYIFLIAGMVYGTLQYRKQYLNDNMSYSQAFTTCFMIGLFCMIILTVFNFIFYKFIDPGIVQQMKDMAREQMLAKRPDMTDQQLEAATSMQDKFMSPGALAIFGLLGGVLVSLVIALILGLFLKKQDDTIAPPAV
jgi:hypothetical protein